MVGDELFSNKPSNEINANACYFDDDGTKKSDVEENELENDLQSSLSYSLPSFSSRQMLARYAPPGQSAFASSYVHPG